MEPITLQDFDPHRDIIIPLPVEYGGDAEYLGQTPFCIVNVTNYVSALWNGCVCIQVDNYELPFTPGYDMSRIVIRWPAHQVDQLSNLTLVNKLFSLDRLKAFREAAKEAACGHTYPNVYDESHCGAKHALHGLEELLRRKTRKSKTAMGQMFYANGKVFRSIEELGWTRENGWKNVAT